MVNTLRQFHSYKLRSFDWFSKRQKRVYSIRWSEDGNRLACGSSDRSVFVAAVDASGRVRPLFQGVGHSEQVDSVSFNPANADILASSGGDKTICLWDIRNDNMHTEIPTKSANNHLEWSPDGRYILCGDKCDRLHIYDVRMYAHLKEISNSVQLYEFVCRGEHVYAVMATGKLCIFGLSDLEPVHSVQAHSLLTHCTTISMSKDGKRLAIGGSDAVCSVWTVDDLICERSFVGHDFALRSCSFSSCGNLIAMGSEDHFVGVCDVNGEGTWTIPVNKEVYCVAWSPTRPILALSTYPDSRINSLQLFAPY